MSAYVSSTCHLPDHQEGIYMRIGNCHKGTSILFGMFPFCHFSALSDFVKRMLSEVLTLKIVMRTLHLSQ